MAATVTNRPFDHSFWSIAGSSSRGSIFIISKRDAVIYLWSYNSVSKKWALLAQSVDTPCIRAVLKGNLVVAYSEFLGRVDVFFRLTEQPPLILRFFVDHPACDHVILRPTTPFPFRMTYGKNALFHFGHDLVFVASERACPYAPVRLRIVKIDTHDQSAAFTMTEMWTSDTIRGAVEDATKVGDKLLVLVCDQFLIFEPLLFGTAQWNPNIQSAAWPSTQRPWNWIYTGTRQCAYLGSCTMPGATDKFWVMDAVNWTEVSLTFDNRLVINRSIQAPNNHTVEVYRHAVVASPTHLFFFCLCYYDPYMHRLLRTDILSKPIAPPTLQQLCLASLFSLPAFERCDNEKKASSMGIPTLAWRRYCL